MTESTVYKMLEKHLKEHIKKVSKRLQNHYNLKKALLSGFMRHSRSNSNRWMEGESVNTFRTRSPTNSVIPLPFSVFLLIRAPTRPPSQMLQAPYVAPVAPSPYPPPWFPSSPAHYHSYFVSRPPPFTSSLRYHPPRLPHTSPRARLPRLYRPHVPPSAHSP